MSTNTISKIQKFVFNNAVRGLIDSSVFTGVQGSGLFSSSTISANENGTASFTLIGEPDGTFYYWLESVSGTINSSDFSSGWADSSTREAFTVTNGIGNFSLTLSEDTTTEGTETFRVKVSKTPTGDVIAQSNIVTIIDTSLTPQPVINSVAVSPNPIDEGATATVSVTTTNIPNGSTLNWDIATGTANSSDISPSSGTVTINNNSGSFTFNTVADETTEGSETYRIYITGTVNGIFLGSLSALRTINDTSVTIINGVVQGSTYGYTSGGHPGPSVALKTIDKFSFSSNTTASYVGDLVGIGPAPTTGLRFAAGQSSETHGYHSGGETGTGSKTNIIQKFSFTSDGNATDIADLTRSSGGIAGQISSTHGYTSGGLSPYSNVIDKFPFSTDVNAVDVGNLTVARSLVAGQSSTDNGYSSGGPSSNVIDKFPFATDANATDVGNLTVSGGGAAGQSSTVSGYTSGSNSPVSDTVDKFPFSTDANATDVGDLTRGGYGHTGQQV